MSIFICVILFALLLLTCTHLTSVPFVVSILIGIVLGVVLVLIESVSETRDRDQTQKQEIVNQTQRLTINNETEELEIIAPLLFPDDNEEKDFSSMSIEDCLRIGYGYKWSSVSLNVPICSSNFLDNLPSSGIRNKCPGLSDKELLAIFWYTFDFPFAKENVYSLVNTELTFEGRQLTLISWKPYLYYLLNGISKIPKWNSTQDVYRGVSGDLTTKFSNKYQVGKRIVWYAFTSTSTKMEKIMAFLKPDITKCSTIIIITQSFSGRKIQDISAHTKEEEVLFPPGSTFKITNITCIGETPKLSVIQVKQIPCREKALRDKFEVN